MHLKKHILVADKDYHVNGVLCTFKQVSAKGFCFFRKSDNTRRFPRNLYQRGEGSMLFLIPNTTRITPADEAIVLDFTEFAGVYTLEEATKVVERMKQRLEEFKTKKNISN